MRFPFHLKTGREFDAVGFGENAVDHLITVPAYPEFDTKVELTGHVLAAGGQMASAIVGLQRLGMRTAYAGRFGSDAEGRFGLESLREEGVDTEFAETVEGAQSQMAFIVIDGPTGERTIIWGRAHALSYGAEEAPTPMAARGRVIHLDAHDPAASARMAEAARAAGTIVSADMDTLSERELGLLPLIDVLVSSKEFPRRLTGLGDERAALLELKARYGFPVVGMTLGVRGALVLCDGLFLESPAYAVPGGCRDTTGAGDAFHAGFIYGMLRGEELEDCMRLGNAVACLKCRALGARTALPTAEELKEFLEQGPVVISDGS